MGILVDFVAVREARRSTQPASKGLCPTNRRSEGPPYRLLMAQIRALRRVPGFETDVELMRSLRPLYDRLLTDARRTARSEATFRRDLLIAHSVKLRGTGT
jgi:hypothetical protein